VLAVASKDMNAHVFAAEKLANLVVYTVGGHRDALLGTFFLKNSLDVSFTSDP